MTKRHDPIGVRTPRADLQEMATRMCEEADHWEDDLLSECLILTPQGIARLKAGKIAPDFWLFWKMAACGLDIQYIITGVRSPNWRNVAVTLNRFDTMVLDDADEIARAALEEA